MTLTTTAKVNLNNVRSAATRTRLIEGAIAALVDIGFSQTTGVEVCRRAGLTRGALNHHFPDYAELFVEALQHVYELLLRAGPKVFDKGPFEGWVHQAYERVIQPEFKAVIELWLASRNDAELGARLTAAIAQSSALFTPELVLAKIDIEVDKAPVKAVYRTILEALIGLGLGRAVNNGNAIGHETDVLGVLADMARTIDLKNTEALSNAS